MAEFLIELYVSRADRQAIESASERARAAAEELTKEGTAVRYVRALFLPEEETCFYFYEAASADQVREAARRAVLPYHSVLEAFSEPRPGR